MVETVLIACHSCHKNFNIPLGEARNYNKNTHFICSTCNNPVKEITARLEDSSLIDQNKQENISSISTTSISIPDPRIQKLNDYKEISEQITNESVQSRLADIREKREQVEREYQAEQTRVTNYAREERRFTPFSFIPIIMFAIILIVIILPLMITEINTAVCSPIPTSTSNGSTACISVTKTTSASTLYTLFPLVIIMVIMFVIIRMIALL